MSAAQVNQSLSFIADPVALLPFDGVLNLAQGLEQSVS